MDSLRAIAMLLGIGLHAALAFGHEGWSVKDGQRDQWFSDFFRFIHGFRMPLFFVVSGFFTAMLWRKRGIASLLKHRTMRILLPCLIGLYVILPVESLVHQTIRKADEHRRELNEAKDKTPFYRFAERGDVGRMKRLLANGADINQAEEASKWTALHFAARNGHEHVIRFLVESEADLEAKDRGGNTAIDVAWENNSVEVAHLLEVVTGKREEGTPRPAGKKIFEHARNGDWRYIQSKLNDQVDPNTISKQFGVSLLAYAAIHNRRAVAEKVLDHNVDINFLNEEHITALHYAVFFGRYEVADLLIQRGADLTIKDQNGYTPADLSMRDITDEMVQQAREYAGRFWTGVDAGHYNYQLPRIATHLFGLQHPKFDPEKHRKPNWKNEEDGEDDDDNDEPWEWYDLKDEFWRFVNEGERWYFNKLEHPTAYSILSKSTGRWLVEDDSDRNQHHENLQEELTKVQASLASPNDFSDREVARRKQHVENIQKELRDHLQRQGFHVINSNQFSHLWFLWFLCWLVAIFAIYSLFANVCGIKKLPDWLVISPLKYLWLVPLIFIPTWLMRSNFGPDTSTGMIPQPHLLFYYAVFFMYGAFYFDSEDHTVEVGKYWWLTLPVAAFLYFFASRGDSWVWQYLRQHHEFSDTMVDNGIRIVSCLFCWLTIFGWMGAFKRIQSASFAKHWAVLMAIVVMLMFIFSGTESRFYQLFDFEQDTRRIISDINAVICVTLSTFALLGMFRNVLATENKAMRYVSDSSYWLYVAHLPVVFALQWWVRDRDWNPYFKFTLVCVVCTQILLFLYEYCVRYTPIGTLLNGKKVRPPKQVLSDKD